MDIETKESLKTYIAEKNELTFLGKKIFLSANWDKIVVGILFKFQNKLNETNIEFLQKDLDILNKNWRKAYSKYCIYKQEKQSNLINTFRTIIQ
jgi:hypothetical protein